MALGPEVAAAYRARGLIREAVDWQWAGAGADLQRALALEPESADSLADYAGYFLRIMGRSAEAVAVLRRAAELDPLSAQVWLHLGRVLTETGEQAAAQKALERALELAPSNGWAGAFLCTSFLLDGRPEEGLAAARRSTSPTHRFLGEVTAHHTLGHAEESSLLLEEMIAQVADIGAFQIAEAFAWRGENDRAFEWLQRARAQRDTGLGLLKSEVLLRGLHGDPRWKPLLKLVNLPLD